MKTNEEKEHAKRVADLLADYMRNLKAERTMISLEMQKYFPQFCALLEQETRKTQNDELKELSNKPSVKKPNKGEVLRLLDEYYHITERGMQSQLAKALGINPGTVCEAMNKK